MRVIVASVAIGASIIGVLAACVGSNPDSDSAPSSSSSTTSSTSTSSGGSSGSSGTNDAGRTIVCNGTFCTGNDVCCVVKGVDNVESATCKPLDQCATFANECDGAEDCADGNVCCAKTNGNSTQWTPSYCAKSCDATDFIYQLCRQPSECDGGSCVASPAATTPTGLKYCK